jgi:arsenate reductase
MGEGIANALASRDWVATSAGTEPSGYVHPLAIRVMQEIDIDISDQQSKSVEQFRDREFDLVITVCDDAAENCPVWLGPGQRVHLGFPDPAEAVGSEEERMEVFRRVRDDMRPAILRALSSREQDDQLRRQPAS